MCASARTWLPLSTVYVPEHYSFASDRSWFNHEWLAEIVMYGSYAAAGGFGLIVLKLLLLLGDVGRGRDDASASRGWHLQPAIC